jgi:hypothetical protein
MTSGQNVLSPVTTVTSNKFAPERKLCCADSSENDEMNNPVSHKFGAIKQVARTVALLALAVLPETALTLHAQSSPAHTRNPANVSYGVIWNLIEEYRDIDVPDDLGSRFDGYAFSVGISVDDHGRIGCGYQPILRRRPTEKGLHVSESLLHRLATPVCHSIETWKFRPFVVDGHPRAFFGPVAVNIERLKFVLADIDPLYKHGPPPIRRQESGEISVDDPGCCAGLRHSGRTGFAVFQAKDPP